MKAVAFLAFCSCIFGAEVNGVVVSGPASPAAASFDRVVTELMQRFSVPGGAIAVAKDGRLAIARGYGLADVEKREPAMPESLFRIASLSKQFTAVAVLQLVEQGKLSLDSHPFEIVKLDPAAGKTRNPKLAAITIRELLQHSGGWDRSKAPDPMFLPIKAAEAVGAAVPASCETVIRYMLSEPLQFDPGTAYAYSNFGYCVLGRVIEKLTGRKYEEYMRTAVLAPLGIRRMRIGHSLLSGRAPGEVKYYDFPGAATATSVFPNAPGMVPHPYGGFNLEAMDSHGAWIASPIDLVRFVLHVDGKLAPAPLSAHSLTEMLAPSGEPIQTDPQTWYGLGWQVRKVDGGYNWWHTGSLPGTSSLVVRTFNGMHWAAVFNSRPDGGKFAGELDKAMWKAAGDVGEWPSRNLFEQYR